MICSKSSGYGYTHRDGQCPGASVVLLVIFKMHNFKMRNTCTDAASRYATRENLMLKPTSPATPHNPSTKDGENQCPSNGRAAKPLNHESDEEASMPD